jgi:hypothetical protein
MGMSVHRETRIPLLVARVASVVCAFPIDCVVETMRPGAIDGDSTMHRGERVPVVDAATLVGAATAPKRCIVIRTVCGRASILVDEVLGVERVELAHVTAMKSLFDRDQMTRVAGDIRSVLETVRVMETPRA